MKNKFSLIEKNKRLLIAEIIICIAIVLAIVLPNICGTTVASDESGDIRGVAFLDGMTAALGPDDEMLRQVNQKYPNSATINCMDSEDAAGKVLDDSADFAVCSYEDAIELRNKYDELYVLPGGLTIKEDSPYALVKKERYVYGKTNLTFDDVRRGNPTIACMSGSDDRIYLEERFPNCKLVFYPALPDIYQAISIGAVDYGSAFYTTRDEGLEQYDNIAALPENYHTDNLCFVFPKNEKGDRLCKEFNEFLGRCHESGEYDKLLAKWVSQDEKNYVIDVKSYKPEIDNGTISVVTLGKWTPMTFIYNNELSGMFVELAYMFCKEYGYTPEFSIADFEGEMAGVVTGEYDMVADIAAENEDRKTNVYFSDTIREEATVLLAKADEGKTKEVPKAQAFWKSLKTSFKNCFINQNRYLLLWEGLKVTLIVSALSIIFGTVLGSIICAMRMGNNTFSQAFAIIYIKVVQGMPIVVLLLLLYYVVFSGTGIDSKWICVLGFSLDFSAYSSEIFRTNIESVPKGQKIAARALGFSNVGAFTKVVLPQALIGILPVYCGQIVSLIKLTSVSGYIATVDLTKSSDLIRSATYEAFFPLITTAVIYFVLASLVTVLLKIVEKRVDPKKKSRIPRGVIVNTACADKNS